MDKFKYFSWNFLKPDLGSKIVSKSAAGKYFKDGNVGFYYAKPDFFNDISLIHAINFDFHPHFRNYILYTGSDILKGASDQDGKAYLIDGKENTVRSFIIGYGTKITIENIFKFCHFYFSCIFYEEGNYRLIKTIQDIEFSRDPTKDELQKIYNEISPPLICINGDNYIMKVNMLYSDSIYELLIEVRENLFPHIIRKNELLYKMPTRQIFLL